MDNGPSNAVLAVKLDALTETLARVEERNNGDHARIEAGFNEHNGRINLLEMYRNKQIGAWTVIAASLGAIVTLVISYIVKSLAHK